MIQSKIHIHALWGTENNIAILTNAVSKILLPQIQNIGIDNNIQIEAISLQTNHIHILFQLPSILSVSDSITAFTKQSAKWANETMALQPALLWSEIIYAVSVSESQCEAVKKYFDNQTELHKTKTFEQECAELNAKFGF